MPISVLKRDSKALVFVGLAANDYLLIAETTKVVKDRLSKFKHVIENQRIDIYNVVERVDFTFIEAREL